jgi:UDP-N-acetylmuramoylalanine--D-glutamate ligase
MSPAPNLKPLTAGTRALVLGLGRTGVSCARYLRRRGLTVRVADTRGNPPGLDALRVAGAEVELRTGEFETTLLDDVAQVVVSPGLSVHEPVVQEAGRRGLPVVGDIELFAREAQAPVAAVTGTNGKSTVTTLVAELASAAGRATLAGGNLGEPALDLLTRPVPELYVLELSSFQLETTWSLRTATSTVLNVTPDHMDRYPDVQAYADAKARVFDGCEVAVINADDELVREMPRPGQRVLSFSLHSPEADYSLADEPEPLLMRRGEPLLPLSRLRIQGLHNAANAMAALAMCEALTLPDQPVLAALAAFGGLPHRAQWVADIDGVHYVNDSKGTNVGATVAAVGGMSGPLVLIAGGDGKNADFSALREAFVGKVRHVVLIGRDGPRIAAALSGRSPLPGRRDLSPGGRAHEGSVPTAEKGSVPSIEFAADMAAAVSAARAAARPGDTVLLSPACASFDMFRDYAQRGEAFVKAVRSLTP